MGEVTDPPEENRGQEASSNEPENSLEEEFDEDLTSGEMQAIDSKLDALNLALDAMESKRENIHEQLMQLLESSREIRKELQEEQAVNVDTGSKENA